MIVESSAIVAILFQEPGYEELALKLGRAPEAGIGAPTLVECGLVVTARLGEDGRGRLARFIDEANITIVPFTEVHFGMAVSAWIRYGQGRHEAALNFGDCLSYAVATAAGMPLLAVGNDFPLAEIALA